MKTKLIIGGIALAMTSMGNAKLPYLDPTHLPTLGSLISALNYGWADSIEDSIDEISAQTVQAETHASNAEAHANNAETAAKTASNKADTAITTANDANTIAQQAATKVASFDTRLINAESDATSAQQIASSANEQAKGATQTAQTASTKVDSYDSRVSAAESKATEAATTATETANTAKQTADSAKASADKVDQFDQRITTAENDAKEAKSDAQKAGDDASKAQQNIAELDQIYSGKINALNKQIDDLNKIIKDEIADRTIKAQDWQSLDDLIKLAQTSPHIDPKLDADHPVIIKLAAKEYVMDHRIYIPAGVIIDGDNKATLHRYKDAHSDDKIVLYAPGALSNLTAINDATVETDRDDSISAMVMIVSESLETPKYSFTFSNIHYSGAEDGIFVQDNLAKLPSDGSYKIRFDHFTSDRSVSSHPVVFAAQDSQFARRFHPADPYSNWFSSAAKAIYISNSTMCISNLSQTQSFPPYDYKQIIPNINISNSSVGDYAQAC